MTKKTDSIMLTPEDARAMSASFKLLKTMRRRVDFEDGVLSGARAQAKKIKKEMEKPCNNLYHGKYTQNYRKHECPFCWEEAFKEVGE